MVAQRWQAAFCVGTPLEPETRLPMPSYEREVAVRQDPNYLPDNNNNNNEGTALEDSTPMIEEADEINQAAEKDQVCIEYNIYNIYIGAHIWLKHCQRHNGPRV